MTTVSSGAGLLTQTGTPLTGVTPLPAAPSSPPGTEQMGDLLPLVTPVPLPEGEKILTSPQDEPEVIEADGDPQQLLALLLAAPLTVQPVDSAPPVSAQAGTDAPSAGASRWQSPADAAGALRNSLLAAGGSSVPAPTAAVVPGAGPVLSGEGSQSGEGHRQTGDGSAAGNRTPSVTPAAADAADAVLQLAPKKLVTPADALRVSRSIQQVMQADRGSAPADSPLLHSAPLLANALIKSEATGEKLPPIVLPAAPEQQAEALKKALAGRLEMQIDRRVQRATIRLDPPNLGKLDISIHFESGKLQVQIQAAQPEVTRLLQQVSQEMRASLSEHNNVQVNVQVSTQSGDSRQQHRHRDRPETAIANNNEEVTAQQHGTDGTILTMV